MFCLHPFRSCICVYALFCGGNPDHVIVMGYVHDFHPLLFFVHRNYTNEGLWDDFLIRYRMNWNGHRRKYLIRRLDDLVIHNQFTKMDSIQQICTSVINRCVAFLWASRHISQTNWNYCSQKEKKKHSNYIHHVNCLTFHLMFLSHAQTHSYMNTPIYTSMQLHVYTIHY